MSDQKSEKKTFLFSAWLDIWHERDVQTILRGRTDTKFIHLDFRRKPCLEEFKRKVKQYSQKMGNRKYHEFIKNGRNKRQNLV